MLQPLLSVLALLSVVLGQPDEQGHAHRHFYAEGPVPIVKFFGSNLQIEQHVKGTGFKYPSVPFYVENSQDFSGSLTFKFEIKGSLDKPGVYPIFYTLYHNGVPIHSAPQLNLTVTDVDECANSSLNECNPSESVCINTYGSYYCDCKPGFRNVAPVREENRGCQDINECLEQLHDCSPDAECFNNRGGYSCVCRTGFEGNGKYCVDIDECASPKLNDCHPDGAVCINHRYRDDIRAGYTCQCKEDEGWVGDGKTCFPKSTCPLNHQCPPNSFCKPNLSHPQRYECVCNSGFRQGYHIGGPVCIDIDECFERTDDCKHPTQCVNLEGGYECRCKPDWAPDGSGGCVNVACSHHKCFPGEVCVPVMNNPDLAFICECDALFKRGPTGNCIPNPASFENLPPSEIKQCQSVTLNVPSVKVADDVDLYLSAPPELYGLYVKDMTPPDRPHWIHINMTDRYGRSTAFPVPIHVVNLDECSVPEDHWTTDPSKLREPKLQYFHSTCKPNCHKLCDPRTPNCAVCIDTPGSYRCECQAPDWRLSRGADGIERCVDNKPPVLRVDPSPVDRTYCFDCDQFFREDNLSLPTCQSYLDRFQFECVVYDNIDPPSHTCEAICEDVGKIENIDGIIHRSFDIIYSATDSGGNRAIPVRKRVNLKIVDLRNTVEELKRLSKIDSSIVRVEKEHQSLETLAWSIFWILLGMLIMLFFLYGRRAGNMIAFLLGAGMSYPAFEEGGTLWLSISRWWWTENERRQFLLTQWALKRE